MRFVSICLSNYIGIYNGMGLYDINIDMTKCRNRITIIRGDNGSGKSTLEKAMNLFPDPNDSFIPDLPARKEIVLQDGETFYRLVFIHGIKQNGDRETTKAYITKTFNNTAVELNENGNVTSYKDILYTELGLDANFAALSQLSNDDRGLADKKPAERKRFVNSIIASLETYNSIHKTLSKRSSNYKSMINAIVAKLNVVGDETTISTNLETLEHKINMIQNEKDQAVVGLAKEQSVIELLDPDGSIQNMNTIISAELDLAERDYDKLHSVIASLIQSNSVNAKDISGGYRKTMDRKNSLIIDNQIARNSIESLINQKDSQARDLNKKIYRLTQLQDGDSYEAICAKLQSCNMQIGKIEQELSKVGLTDISDISKEEYIFALETLKDLDEYISAFKSCVSYEIMQNLINEYISTGVPPRPIDINPISMELSDLQDKYNRILTEQSAIRSSIGILDKLNIRPSSCKDDTCPFIKEAIELSKTKPNDKLNILSENAYNISELISSKSIELGKLNEFNDAANKFAVIVREITKNGAILSKMPNGEMFKDKSLFFERLLNGYGFEYMSSIYQYIDLANLFDTYKHLIGIKGEYESELKIYESKSESIRALEEEIDEINKSISHIVDQIEPINTEIACKTREIAELQELEGVYQAIMDAEEKQKPIMQKIKDCRARLAENSKKINEINVALSKSEAFRENINKSTFTLTPMMKERDKLLHSVQMMQDYKKELEELQTSYDYIETIKYYSSPTTGIQLVFMELYMGKIIALANELLKLLFKGQFVIQPFVINESEFRIPCLGNGYLNDDISSMSSSQIGMISMILSFSLLHHSSTKYNIIKLDEIDGPLDYNNRVYFIDVLNSIMDIMGTEQCIMISHNSELQVDNSDVILLKHDEDNMDYNRGNIIWSY